MMPQPDHPISAWVDCPSSHSPPSSFSSSASSSTLQTPAPLPNSSHSDIFQPEHAWGPSLSTKNISATAAGRSLPSSSNANVAMGQNYSRDRMPTSPVSPASQLASKGITAAATTGMKLKRAFAGRRKKSSANLPEPGQNCQTDDKEKDHDLHSVSKGSSIKSASMQTQLRDGASRTSAKGLTMQLASQVFSSRKTVKTVKPLPLLPASPPSSKPAQLQAPKKTVLTPASNNQPRADHRSSTMPVGQSLPSATDSMRVGEEQRDVADQVIAQESEKERVRTDPDKESWRKSDSTMSHHTVRPAATVGSRTPRPVSMAESLHSTNTVVPMNKRLSAVVTEAEFSMAVEDFHSKDPGSPGSRRKLSPTSSLKSKNRRSMSLNLTPALTAITGPTTPPLITPTVDVKHLSAPPSPYLTRETPTLTRAAANGIIAPSTTGPESTGNNIRSRLAALTATANASSSALQEHSFHLPPPVHPQRSAANSEVPISPSLRRTAVSITSGFAPTAGLAKRAVERMGRAWGGMSSSSSSGHSSSSSITSPSSYSGASRSGHVLDRTESEQSLPSLSVAPPMSTGNGKQRRTPQATSGSWSVASSSTGHSEPDPFLSAGPVLGMCMRGPIYTTNTSGRIVFGRDLISVTRRTAVEAVRNVIATGRYPDAGEYGRKKNGSFREATLKALETRVVPAIVVRCAQHLIIWGLKEEGLFRVPGRPTHVNKLRTEFDTGADYDMTESSPGDLDPHAVASIFKAYLRELPEPILTHALLPYFDTAMNAESSDTQEIPRLPRGGARGPGLPSGPRSGAPTIRKPPSLSTLAMPSFSGLRPPSQPLLKTFKNLIARLPRENRDLIRTVADLITATARESKETKMPLSNLLVVFCPSLNLSPSLLRVLCENESIWGGVDPEDSPVLDIKRDSTVIDISASGTPTEEAVGSDSGHSLQAPVTASRDIIKAPKPDDIVDAIRETIFSRTESEAALMERAVPRSKSPGVRRLPVKALYMDDESFAGTNFTHHLTSEPEPTCTPADAVSLRDDSSYASTSESNSLISSMHGLSNFDILPPLLTSSAESLSTPSSSSREPSFTHLPLPSDPYSKVHNLSHPGSPIIAEPVELPLPSMPRRPVISGPIELHTNGSANLIPVPRRRSIPILSLSSHDLPFDGTISDPSTPNRMRKLTKPSLHRLFGRRSASPLSGTANTASSSELEPRSDSDSSISTPRSMFTAPQASPQFPPVLDTPVDSSPLNVTLAVNHEGEQRGRREEHKQREESGHILNDYKRDTFGSHSRSSLLNDGNVVMRAASASSTSLLTGPTPIADLFRSQSTASLYSLMSLEDVGPQPRKRPSAAASTTSSARLGTLSNEDEDWSRSVLMAADLDGGWEFRDSVVSRP